MLFSLVGVNHQTAPVSIREKVAISVEKLGDALSQLHAYVPQGIILSTCNRTEIYATDSSGDAQKASLEFLRARLNVSPDSLPRYIYIAKDKDVAEHLFRVASGLESMIVGEYEVLGQIGQALEAAEKAGMVNLPLRHIFHSALRTGRRVREETGISRNALSVSSVAVDLAERIVGDLKQCRMLVIGSGEAGRLVAKAARERGTSQIVIANRTRERAEALAEALQGIPIGMDGVADELHRANIVVACAASPRRLLEAGRIETAMKDRPELPLVIIDIALPRNVAPGAAQVKNVHLYNIDALTEISNLNRKQREGEIQHAEAIIAEEVGKLASWWQDYDVRPMVSALMSKAEAIRSAQLGKTLRKLRPLSKEEQANLEAMTQSIVNKLLNDPVQFLKKNGNSNYCQMVNDIFHLNVNGDKPDDEKR